MNDGLRDLQQLEQHRTALAERLRLPWWYLAANAVLIAAVLALPFLVYAPDYKLAIDQSVPKPGLANMASSVLYLLGYRAPSAFMPSLIRGA